MFDKKKLPKIYCKITVHKDIDIAFVDFYWTLAFKTVNKFWNILQEKRKLNEVQEINSRSHIDLDTIYHFLANENFTPITETFFYRDMEKRDQLWEDE